MSRRTIQVDDQTAAWLGELAEQCGRPRHWVVWWLLKHCSTVSGGPDKIRIALIQAECDSWKG